jgi:Fur family ferric uptake transcriptional regulator
MEINSSTSNDWESSDMFKILLNQEGFRFTQQRQKILDVLKTVPEGEHLSAEQIYQQLSAQGEAIGISTIYRALHLLVSLGLVRELALSEDRKYYELNAPFMGEHHHLVCVQCGQIREFQDSLISDVGHSEAALRGFDLLTCQFTLYVLCPDCAVTSSQG